MFRIHLRQLGTSAVWVAALMTMAPVVLLAPGTAFAQRTITVVLPEEPDSLDNCNSARSAVGRVIRQNVNETLVGLDPGHAAAAEETAWDHDMAEHRDDYRRKRDRLLAVLDPERFRAVKPGGAFYFFIPAPWGTATEFVEKCIENNLLVLPGSIFSRQDTHFRVSYAAKDEVIDAGAAVLNRLARG